MYIINLSKCFETKCVYNAIYNNFAKIIYRYILLENTYMPCQCEHIYSINLSYNKKLIMIVHFYQLRAISFFMWVNTKQNIIMIRHNISFLRTRHDICNWINLLFFRVIVIEIPLYFFKVFVTLFFLYVFFLLLKKWKNFMQ